MLHSSPTQTQDEVSTYGFNAKSLFPAPFYFYFLLDMDQLLLYYILPFSTPTLVDQTFQSFNVSSSDPSNFCHCFLGSK